MIPPFSSAVDSDLPVSLFLILLNQSFVLPGITKTSNMKFAFPM